MKPRIIKLQCACCGSPAPAFKQWHNQDKGYGVCASCCTHISAKYDGKPGYEPDYAVRAYGRPGEHHSIEAVQP